MWNVIKNFAESISVPSNQVGLPKVEANDATFDAIINSVFIVLGGAAALYLALGALKYVMSNGDMAKIKQAKDMMIYSVVGIIVSLLAFTIVQFVLGRII